MSHPRSSAAFSQRDPTPPSDDSQETMDVDAPSSTNTIPPLPTDESLIQHALVSVVTLGAKKAAADQRITCLETENADLKAGNNNCQWTISDQAQQLNEQKDQLVRLKSHLSDMKHAAQDQERLVQRRKKKISSSNRSYVLGGIRCRIKNWCYSLPRKLQL